MVFLWIKPSYMTYNKPVSPAKRTADNRTMIFRKEIAFHRYRIVYDNYLTGIIIFIPKQPSSRHLRTRKKICGISFDAGTVAPVHEFSYHSRTGRIMRMSDHLPDSGFRCQPQWNNIGCGQHIHMHHIIISFF